VDDAPEFTLNATEGTKKRRATEKNKKTPRQQWIATTDSV
jgi:hypothetical protein